MKRIIFFVMFLSAGSHTFGQKEPLSVSGGPASLDEYAFISPPGWVATRYVDGIVLSPAPPNPERCNITLHIFRPAGANLEADAIQVFNEVFKGFVGKQGMTSNSLIRGSSVQGWDYFIIKAAIGMPGGDYETMFGFVCVIRLGNQLASLSGISKDPLVSACFGLNLTNVWPKFFYSLQFRNKGTGFAEREMMRRIAGIWMSATATAGDRMVIAPNGRYADAAASQSYRVTPTSVITITDAYFGNGAYVVKGYHIMFTSDDDKSKPAIGLYRLEEESGDNGKTWKRKLYITRTSTVDGAEYEVCYDLQF